MKKKMTTVPSTLTVTAILLVLMGCGQTITKFRPNSKETRHNFFKNYELNATREAFVGDPVVKATDYYSIIKAIPAFRPNKDFVIRADLAFLKKEYRYPELKGGPADLLTIAGIAEGHYLVSWHYQPADANFHFGAMIKDGRFVKKCIDIRTGRQLGWGNEFTIEPDDVRFELAEIESVDGTKGYVNFEIVYSGMDDNGMKFLYREYTKDDLAKPAFYQELTYPSKAKQLRFRKIKVEIEEASSEKIKYKVLEDGMDQKKTGRLTEIVD